jgi:hypothetical protein
MAVGRLYESPFTAVSAEGPEAVFGEAAIAHPFSSIASQAWQSPGAIQESQARLSDFWIATALRASQLTGVC